MKSINLAVWLLFRMLIIPSISHAGTAAIVAAPTLNGAVSAKSWKEIRDAQVIKQDLDYSCGAASLATLLNGFYGQVVTEEEILQAMGKEDAMASFFDMAAVLPRYGFKGMGMALGFEQLKKLKIPVIVYLQYRGDDHFSVLRGVSDEAVWLGDPSWGNRKFSKTQFLAMWETRDDPQYRGKVLLVLPAKEGKITAASDFFATPETDHLPLELLGVRRF